VSWVDRPTGGCGGYTGGPVPTQALSISGSVDDDPALGFVAKTLGFITPDPSMQAQRVDYTVDCGSKTEARFIMPNIVEPVALPPLWEIPLEKPFKTIAAATPYAFKFTFTPPDQPMSLLTVQGTLKPRYKLAVDLNPPELDPTGQSPNSTVTVRMTIGGLPGRDEVVDIKACTKVDPDNDGHVHDKRADPCDNTRPAGKLDNQNQYPVKKTTGQDGTFTMNYTPPLGGIYYISGTGTITATFERDDTVKDEQDIVTRVKNLTPMWGSTNCVGGGTYYFFRQNNHACLFYGTAATNQGILAIANAFSQAQIDCRDGTNSTYGQNAAGNNLTTPGEPKPIRITAMSLPWGGLLDMGPPALGASFWNPPHKTHDAGTAVDVSWHDFITGRDARGHANAWEMDRVLLLRWVILNQPGASLPVPSEGGDIAATQATQDNAHFHTKFG
jgi:hypothetical protein